jgi:hypothetical protein
MPDDPTTTETEKNSGGKGGSSAINLTTLRFTTMALTERWPISREARDAAVKMLEDIMVDPASSKRAKRYVIKTFASLSRINLAAIDTALRAQAQEDIDVRLREIEARLPRNAIPSET